MSSASSTFLTSVVNAGLRRLIARSNDRERRFPRTEKVQRNDRFPDRDRLCIETPDNTPTSFIDVQRARIVAVKNVRTRCRGTQLTVRS